MTNEEAIREIQDASDYEVRHGDIEHHHEDIMRRVEAFEKAVNALQQEPVLDKIRAEIANLDDADYDYEGYYKAVTDVLQIIDKYKAEMESEG